MNHASDTPPDGDFARYIEELTRRSQPTVPVAAEDMRKPLMAANSRLKEVVASMKNRTAPQPFAATLKTAFAGISFSRHVWWLVALWILAEVLSRVVAGADFLILPVLAAYVLWLFSKLNKNLDGALVQRLQSSAEAPGAKASRPK